MCWLAVELPMTVVDDMTRIRWNCVAGVNTNRHLRCVALRSELGDIPAAFSSTAYVCALNKTFSSNKQRPKVVQTAWSCLVFFCVQLGGGQSSRP